MRSSVGLCAVVFLLACVSGREVRLGAPPRDAPKQHEPLQRAAPGVLWQERFAGPTLTWVAPFGHSSEQVAAVYSLSSDQGHRFLHARHDARKENEARVPAINFGMRFEPLLPLERLDKLRWKWRVLRHPEVTEDPWLDLGASLYVIVQQPSMLRKGKGFKFGWVARKGPPDTRQVGLAQIELRSDPAGAEWKQEEVDLCALYKKLYGPCEGEHLEFLGVLTDADGTHSVAEGDYADFEITKLP